MCGEPTREFGEWGWATSWQRHKWAAAPIWVKSVTLLLLLSTGAALDTHSYMLMNCYKQPEELKWKSLTFDEFVAGEPTRLQLHTVLKGPTPRHDDGTGGPVLTVATALTVERLEALLEQCQSWPGLLAAALYVPLLQPDGYASPNDARHQAELQRVQQAAQAAVDRSAQMPNGCSLQVLIAYEYVTSLMLAHIIPINALRNLAILAVTTPLVAMIDVDLLVSSNLGEQLVTGPYRDRWSQAVVDKVIKDRTVLILPAFQTPKDRATNMYPEGPALQRDIALVHDLVKRNKTAVFKAVMKDYVLIKFASQQFPVGHGRTNFGLWYDAPTWYAVRYMPQFEPWFIADRLNTPFYDVNFRGYGRNKQQQSAHVASMGTSFWVHPQAFVIHLPHGKSDAQKDHDSTWLHMKAQLDRVRRRQQHKPQDQPHARRLKQLVPTTVEGAAAAMQAQTPEALAAKQGLLHVKRLDRLFRGFMRQMSLNQYRTLIDRASAKCLQELPWWRGANVLQWSTTESNVAGL